MPNKKGFTLVELIATVTIMLLITVIVTPNILNYVNNGKERQYEQLESQILSAAKDYYIKNKDAVASNSNKIPLSSLKDEIDEEFVENGKIIDPTNNGQCFTDESYVQVERNTGEPIKYEFKPTTGDCQ